MKKLIFALSLISSFAHAADLAECEKKIAEMLKPVPKMQVKVFNNRVDQYFVSSDGLCGVELRENDLTVTTFLSPVSEEKMEVAPKKFETIILNGNDPTFTDGRVKAKASCEITENSVEYNTRVPILTDGMKTPVAIEKLTIIREGDELRIRLRASLTPIHKVFRSNTDCLLTSN